MWEELASYDQIPVCKRGLCKCNLTSELEKKCEEEKVHQFLMGLDDTLWDSAIQSSHSGYSTYTEQNLLNNDTREWLRTMTRTVEEHGEVMAFAA